MANHDLSKAEWLNKAEAYCARAEHCAADIRRKLFQWGAPEYLSDETGRTEPLWREIEQSLYANDFLNDARFCQAYVHDKLMYQHWGRLKIQAALSSLQLPDGAINDALNSIDEEDYLTILRSVADEGRRMGKTDVEKLTRFLLQRGFSYSEIKKIKL